jgi:hypothetical protein
VARVPCAIVDPDALVSQHAVLLKWAVILESRAKHLTEISQTVAEEIYRTSDSIKLQPLPVLMLTLPMPMALNEEPPKPCTECGSIFFNVVKSLALGEMWTVAPVSSQKGASLTDINAVDQFTEVLGHPSKAIHPAYSMTSAGTLGNNTATLAEAGSAAQLVMGCPCRQCIPYHQHP